MAAELATGLVPGTDCPVCGSRDHPRPAQGTEPAVTPAAERSAEAAVAAAEAARQAGERAVAASEVALAEQTALAGGDTSVEDLRSLAEAAAGHRERTATAAALVPAAETAFDDFAAEHEQWERDKVAHETEQRSAAARAAEHQSAAARLTAELRSAQGDDPTIAARRERLERTARDLEGLAGHLSDLDRLERAVDEALARVQAAVAERGLRSVEEVSGAVRDDERLQELERLVRVHDAEAAVVAEHLTDPEVAGALALPSEDLDARRTALAEAEAARDRALAAAHAAAERVRRLVRRADEVAATRQTRRPLAERHRLVDGLARLAEGKSADNVLRMSLSAYVLAARLEQVAASASERLLRMTSGRYSLVHSATAAGGRARGGLTLDSWTGRLRDPASLSGGETFSASLALALGLADVVTAEAGGALLETLFVDEGFGSLDEDTLDDVMGVLDDLREGGRTVGIVSHVADLRQRVPVQLHVKRGRTGSTIAQ
jgi:exonuclease SbcC